ncbi:MAG: sulfite exporter TauE/SafE family protein [Candidatus Pacearchaeota archaeon]|jgi:sulfite exporter TauE/SafE/copper chaperone CopZ
MIKTFKIKNITCNSCADRIEEVLKPRVNKIKVSYSKGEAVIDYDPNKITEKEIKNVINEIGYDLVEHNKPNKNNMDIIGYIITILGVIFIMFLLYYFISNALSNVDFPEFGDNASYILIFLIGILTGFHCIGMCGPFVYSYTSNNASKGYNGYLQHFIYGGSKTLSYTIIGGILGLIGGLFAFRIGLRASIAILAGIFMIFYGLSMLGLSFFRKFQINPKFLTNFIKNSSKSTKGYYKAPMTIGLLNGLFIACGPLQAMYIYAAGTGSFFKGATSLAVFGLGTIPIMIGFGSMITNINHNTTKKILKFSAVIVIILGLIMLNRGLTLLGSDINYETIKTKLISAKTNNEQNSNSLIKDGYQEINMVVDANGFTPDTFVLKKGVPVKWNIDAQQITNCNKEIIVRDYNLDIKLKKGLNVVEFTPNEAGTIRWSCWMGMIPGTFVVTETGIATTEEVKIATPKSTGGSCGGSCGGSSSGGCGGSCGGCGK